MQSASKELESKLASLTSESSKLKEDLDKASASLKEEMKSRQADAAKVGIHAFICLKRKHFSHSFLFLGFPFPLIICTSLLRFQCAGVFCLYELV